MILLTIQKFSHQKPNLFLPFQAPFCHSKPLFVIPSEARNLSFNNRTLSKTDPSLRQTLRKTQGVLRTGTSFRMTTLTPSIRGPNGRSPHRGHPSDKKSLYRHSGIPVKTSSPLLGRSVIALVPTSFYSFTGKHSN